MSKKISINSRKISVGEKLTCVRPMAVLLTPGKEYEILHISDSAIQIMDNDDDKTFPLSLSKDKDESPSIFKYFQIWY
jgi:hypothetical protein